MPIKSARWKKGHIAQKQNDDRIERTIFKLRKEGILPREGQELTEEQKKIYLQAKNGQLQDPEQIQNPVSPPTMEFQIWGRIRETAMLENQSFTIELADIHVPTHCPYLNIELSYDIKDRDKPNYFFITRIDRTKGYDKDNTIIISRKANIIKNLCVGQEFVTLAQNILKIHQK